MTDEHNMRLFKRYEKGLSEDEFDLQKESLKYNPFLENYGKDRLSFRAENTYTTAAYYHEHEAKIAHGYPLTAWIQHGLVVACGMYTAKEQGIFGRGQYFGKFW